MAKENKNIAKTKTTVNSPALLATMIGSVILLAFFMVQISSGLASLFNILNQPIILKNVKYGSAYNQILDIYLPPSYWRGEPRPAVILIHGGTFGEIPIATSLVGGLNKNFWEPYAKQLAFKKGFVVFAINYRQLRFGQYKWPTMLDDCRQALDWVKSGKIGLRYNFKRYNYNSSKIGIVGSSLGGLLGGLLSIQPETKNKIKATVLFYPATDLNETFKKGFFFAVLNTASDLLTQAIKADADLNLIQARQKQFIGFTYQENPTLYEQAKVANYVTRGQSFPNLFIIHGTLDTNAPYSLSYDLYRKFQQVNISNVKFESVPAATHAFLEIASMPAIERVANLSQTLKSLLNVFKSQASNKWEQAADFLASNL